MATSFTFNGKVIKLPGAYSQIQAAVNNQPLDLSSGNVIIIDKDATNPFGGGASIKGQTLSGEKAIYPFDNLNDFRNFIRGGQLYDLALPLFRPNGAGSQGVSKLYYVRAFETVAALLNITWTGGGANGGVLRMRARHEGVCGNGVQGNETLAKQIMTITAIGAAASTIIVTANAIALGTYTSDGTGSTTDAANSYAAIINANTFTGLAHGFSATAIGAVVTITAPANSGAAANAYVFAVGVTGTATATVGAGTMAGGVDGNKLTRGLAMTMEAGTIDTAKFKVKFYRGSFTGLDSELQAYDGISEADTTPELIAESPEFDNISTVINWAKINFDFNNHIELLSTTVATGTGTVTSADLASTTGNKLFAGGTQTYATARVSEVLDSIVKLDYSNIFSMDAGVNYSSADNGKILSHLQNNAKYEKFLWVAGGDDKDSFTSISVTAANFFNDQRVQLIHGGVFVTSQLSGVGLKQKGALYKMAHIVGRTCGLAPQTPITFKALGYAGEVHPLTQSEKEQALDNGVMVTEFDSEIGSHIVILGCNTLQQNDFMVNDDGKSHLLSVRRIAAQLNKELEINIKRDLLGNQTQGPNVATLSKEVVRNYVSKYLKRKTATATVDNLIIMYQGITVQQQQDALFVQYEFKGNTEINKIFITGTLLDPNA